MKHRSAFAALPGAVFAALAILGAQEKAPEKPKAEEKSEKKAPAPPAAADNLAIPDDMPPRARKALEEGLKALSEAETAGAGRAKLLASAVSKLKTARDAAAASPLPRYHLGGAYLKQEKFKEAKASLQKALEMNPRFHEACILLGHLHTRQKKLKEALALYDRALEIHPSSAEALEARAYPLISLGRFEEARTCVERAAGISRDPRKRKTYQQLLAQIVWAIHGPSWKKTFNAETENYVLRTSVSQDVADDLARQVELIRVVYDKFFPDIKKPERKYQILVFEDAYAYHVQGGGPEEAGGHYDPTFRILCLPQHPDREKTISVLFHEAFHQYLQDYVESAPYWFNEGVGEFFAAFRPAPRGKPGTLVSRPHPDHLEPVKLMITSNLAIPAAEMMHMRREEFYSQSRMMLNYQQAWAMVYFMFEAKKQNYGKVLVKYFQELKKGQDIDEAYAATFGKQDMARFDGEWKAFIAGLGGS
jgi:tetratricopeptide (TPR) repeat protein